MVYENQDRSEQGDRRSMSIEPLGPFGERRVLILGDSWVRGLLTERRQPFGRLIALGLGGKYILDLSETGRTTPDLVANHLTEIAGFRPELTVVTIGGSDSLIFPHRLIQTAIERFTPRRWHGIGALLPTARYSESKARRFGWRFELSAKACIKQVVVHLFGGRRRVSVSDFEMAVRNLFGFLAEQSSLLVVIGLTQVDRFSSPMTNDSIDRTNAVLARLTAGHPGAIYVPSAQLVDCWDDYLVDRIHLNKGGHRRVAAGVLDALRNTGEPWAGLLNNS